MKKIYSLLFFALIFIETNSQVNYSFSATTGTYTSITGTSPTLTQSSTFAAADEGFANSIPIGFPFNYNGTVYSTVSLNTNGFLAFVNMVPRSASNETYYFDDLSDGPYIFSTDIRPILSPFWDDLDLVTASNLRYATSGTAGSRVFTVEWANVRADYSATAAVISFQVKLYETTGVVEFIYRSEAGTYTHTENENDGASIGITSTGFGSGTYLSLNNAGSSPTVSSTVATSTIVAKPATGQVYRFTPTFALPVSLSNFTAERVGGVAKLKWATLNEQNNLGFEVQRSLDGSNFSKVGFVSSNTPNGNSNSTQHYSFNDLNTPSGNAYYRLQQTDKDGRATLSSVLVLKAGATEKLAVRSVYPNPTYGTIKLLVASPANDKIEILITDVVGRVVMVERVNVTAGENVLNLNVSKIAVGNYSIKATSKSGEISSGRFVKQ